MRKTAFTIPIRISLIGAKFICLCALLGSNPRADSLEFVGSTLWPGASDVKVVGAYAYCACDAGLKIYDISNPEDPALTGQFFCAGCKGVSINGNYAFLAEHQQGLKILDISDRTRPYLISALETAGDAVDIEYQNGFVYLADFGANIDGIRIIDVSNPYSPVPAGSYAINYALRIKVSGDYAYLISQGLKIVDVSDPENPDLVGVLSFSTTAQHISVSGNYAYIISEFYMGPTYLNIVNISEPSGPALISDMIIPWSIEPAVNGDFLYLPSGEGLKIIDVSDPGNPFYASEPGFQMGFLYIAGNYLFSGGLEIFDISDPINPVFVGGFLSPGGHDGFQILGDYAYIASGNGLSIVDLTEPSNPILSGQYDIEGWNHSAAAYDGYAYLANHESGLYVIDSTDPLNPSLIEVINLPGEEYDVYVFGNHLYLTADGAGLYIFNISTPWSPVQTGFCSIPDYRPRVYVDYDYAYVVSSEIYVDFYFVNKDDPSNPFIESSFDTEVLAENVHVDNGYAYVAGQAYGIRIFDISDISNPILVGSLGTGTVFDAYYQDNYLFAPGSCSGLCVLDVSNPAEPEMAFSFDTPGNTRNVAPGGDYICVSSFSAFTILRLDRSCSYVPGDCDHNGTPLELGDVIAMINMYRGTVGPYHVCDCPPHGSAFAATADPNGNCAANELSDVTTEIAAYRGLAEASGCPDCPGSD